MARAVWSGTVSFGLVNVPVKAFTAVRDHDVHFHRVVEGSTTRVRNKQVNEKTGREVPSEKIEMGYELDSGNYVTFDPKEIEDLRPRSTRSIEARSTTSSAKRMVDMANAPSTGRTAARYCLVRMTTVPMATRSWSIIAASSSP